MITIENAIAAMPRDLNVVGAAFKIIAAGAHRLTEPEMRRACGATHYLWTAKRDEILQLVRLFEGAGDA